MCEIAQSGASERPIRALMRLEKPGVQDIVAALMDEGNHQPLDVSLATFR